MIKGKQLEQGSVPQDRLDSVSQAKLNNSALDNDFDTVTPLDASLQQYNSSTNKWEANLLQAGYLYFPIWAEENASLNTGTSSGYQWAYGNGSTTPNASGVNIGVDCELISIGLSCSSTLTNADIGVEVNSVQVANSGPQSSTTNFLVDITPVSITKGDFINFRTLGGTGTGSNRVVAWFRYEISGLVGPTGASGLDGANFNDQLFGDGIPSNGLGNDGDIYFDNLSTGDIYLKNAGTWSFQLNIQGDSGAAGADGVDGANFNDQLFGNGVPSNGLGNDGDIYFDNDNGDLYNKIAGSWIFQQNLAGGGGGLKSAEYSNTSQTTVNDSAVGTPWNSINTTAIFDNSGGSLYTAAIDGITVLSEGDYEVYANFYQTSTVQRSNVAIEFTVDSVQQGIRSAGAYVRSTGGHNEASTNLKQILSLTANQKVSVDFIQLATTGTVTIPAGQSIFSIKKIA